MKTWLKVILLVVVFGSFLVAYIWFFVYNKPHIDYDQSSAVFSLKADDLYNEFKNDSKKASLKYNGKVVEVIGKLSSVEKTDSLVVGVFTFEVGMFGDQGVRCSFLPKYFNQVKELQNGADVKFKGVCQGYNDTDVILESAAIVE